MHEIFGHRRQIADGAIRLGLRDGADTGNHDGDGGVGENPFEGGLREGVSEAGGGAKRGGGEILPDGFGVRDGAGETVAGEIFGAEIVGGEGRVGVELPREHALVEGDAHDDGDAAFACDVEEFGGGFLLKEVVDDLHRIDPATAHEVDHGVLILLGRGNTDETEAAFALKGAKNFEGCGVAVPRPGPGVKLEEIEFFGAEVGAARGDVFAEVAFGIAIVGAVVGRGRPRAGGGRGFGGDEDAGGGADGGALAQDPGDEFFAAAVAIAGGGVDEVDAEIERPMERGEGIGVGLRAPRATDGPCTEADFGGGEGVLAKEAELHGEGCSGAGRVRHEVNAGFRRRNGTTEDVVRWRRNRRNDQGIFDHG